ncbi:ATP-dependent carboxylate-amine ligase [Parafrankia sp. BMG5.11]|uniref:ATP-dependent carboxylate-amine ligase n=1 Tax=Parafrankia sp. BMG5.11 TaxID=222540 RepID=UPI00103F0AB9|nr:ATP-dependent carboxylate-amine ligase [Parafrankia sp. BMG5.11]TCJ32012.1 ATP-dependent carboxylate-amine ligase [Parafrankia sp. BMG5.11]
MSRPSRPFLLHFAEAEPSPSPSPSPSPARAAVDVRDLVARLMPALADRTAAEPEPVVLLLAYSRNPDTVLLERALLARGVPCRLLGADDFPTDVTVTWRGDGKRTGGDVFGLDSAQVRSVWFGLAGPTGVPARRLPPFETGEWADALAGWWRSCPAPFVNDPDAGSRAGNKITSLEHAAEEGLTVPDTLVTNDPDQALAFCHAYGSAGVIAKSLNSHYVELDGRRHSLFTRVLSAADLALLPATLAAAPCVFQPLLDSRLELRVTVVDEQVFTASTATADLAAAGLAGSGDVRRVRRAVPMTAHCLDDDVAHRCVRLVAGLGLRYAALDLIVTPDGDHVFLDLNPRGGWWFAEQRAGLPISDAVAGLLS